MQPITFQKKQKLSAGQWMPKKHSRNSQRRDRPGFAPVFPFKARRPPEVTKAEQNHPDRELLKSPERTGFRKKSFGQNNFHPQKTLKTLSPGQVGGNKNY